MSGLKGTMGHVAGKTQGVAQGKILTPPAPAGDFLLKEDSGFILLEDGTSRIKLEGSP